jgi:hypothetical protein
VVSLESTINKIAKGELHLQTQKQMFVFFKGAQKRVASAGIIENSVLQALFFSIEAMVTTGP